MTGRLSCFFTQPPHNICLNCLRKDGNGPVRATSVEQVLTGTSETPAMKRAALLAAFAAFAVTSHANFLINGGFEQPGANPWQHFSNGQVPGWRTSSGVIEIGRPVVYGVTGAHGLNVMETDSTANVYVSQSVSLSTGQYELSFLFSKRGSNLENRPGNTCDFDVLWNNTVVASMSPSSSTMSTKSIVVNGITGVNTVAFRGMGASDGMGALIDDVDLQSVPEPCSMTALGTLALVAVRKKLNASRQTSGHEL